MTCRNHLLLFTRYPEIGQTKTRLIPTLGAGGAAQLQKLMTERIVMQACILAEQYDITTIIHHSGGSKEKMTSWLGPLTFVDQADGDLGLRMQMAFTHAFSGGTKAAVLIGSDIPGISADLLASAFAALQNTKVTIGPSRDGGYYLIGMRADAAEELYPLLFEQIVWSTSMVFAHTCQRLEKAAIETAIMPTLHDIDTPEDLAFARNQGLL
ncbi:MAG: TIGR04282 family arsenosugar biosynthesis glycosyltransferase [Proteobacteria bacterium]|nr:TIGR04282 family arsenosugar biosynthesis glycosyltransferase [Pseudomonadota bacterium]